MPITDRYLKDPASFPSPDQGEPWGDEELWIDFVGGPYRVAGLNATQHMRLAENFAECCTDRPKQLSEAVCAHVRKIDPDLFQPPAALPREISFDLEATTDSLQVSGQAMCGVIHCAERTAGTLWAAADDSWFTRNVFENFFRMLVTYRVLEVGGLLLHSAGVISRGQAYLFPGRSGNGKSTLSRLSLEEGRMVLSDDMNAVIWQNGKPWVEKVPFAGDLGRSWARSKSYPLRAILTLEKSDTNSVRDLHPVRAMAFMAACAPYLNADSHRTHRLLESLQELSKSVPTRILSFSPNKGVWPLIERSVES